MTRLHRSRSKLLPNPRVNRGDDYHGARLHGELGSERFVEAARAISSWPGYAATALVSLPGIAARAGVGSVFYKDEGTRFGVGSFKALGAPYALSRLLASKIKQRAPAAEVTNGDLLSVKFRDITQEITVTCATDGNHGRALAWGARLFGCQCIVYVHEDVSRARAAAIASLGGRVRRVPGNYDDAVRCAAREAAENGWLVVSDTSYEGYGQIPLDVMQGYAVMVEEALQQMPARNMPSHVFIQGGVGGLAAAVCSHLWERFGTRRPRLVVVEPTNAACLYESARRRSLTRITGKLNTIMAGLACGEPSPVAWRVLEPGADAFMVIVDDLAMECMRLLASGESNDRVIVAGESGVAGLAGLLGAAASARTMSTLGLDNDSRVLVFGTEGATDEESYRRIVGRSAAEVRRGVPART